MIDITYDKDIETNVQIFNNRLKALNEQYLNVRSIRVKNRRELPFLDNNVRQLIKERNRLKFQFNKMKRQNITNYDLYAQYKNLRNKVNITLRDLQKKWYSQRVKNCKNNPKKLWKVLSEVMSTKGNKSKTELPIDLNLLNEEFINTPKVLADSFNNDRNLLITPLNTTFSLTPAKEENIQTIVKNLDNRKAIGFDEISPKMLKISQVLIYFITTIINISFVQRVYPQSWKLAKVIALFKQGSRTDPLNYRPVSLLPLIGKISEKEIFDNLYKYLTDNDILSDCQFGFRRKHSCSDAILVLLHNIYKKLNHNMKVCVVSIDLKKAFDTIDHKIMLLKLTAIGCDTESIEWFQSYLDNRKQFIVSNGNKSDIKVNNIGVPQGSILGPLLFAIYINDFCNIDIDCEMILYADDCNLIISAKTFKELEKKVNDSLIKVNDWMNLNRLTINVQKTNYMLINLSGRATENINIRLNNNELEKVSSVKILGIFVDNRLAFNIHINHICKKISNRIKLIRRLKNKLTENILNMIFKAIVLPIIDYGICIYGFTYHSHYTRIEKLIRTAAKTICSSDAENSVLMSRLNWKTFNERREYFCRILIHKSINGLNANKCKSIFEVKSCPIRTRSVVKNEVKISESRLTCYQNSIFYEGIKLYNKLDPKIRSIQDLKRFLSLLRNLK